ncbi:MAG TPA: Nif3-like dinuclear metal center hexameric protein [Clostridiales bacterium]|nr:Nif3-like dinuclear metal center hexameric protein [Clostridiales bacterium]
MSVKAKDIIAIMDAIAPPIFAEDWDNIGLLLGERNRDVDRILVTLDLTSDMVNEAIKRDIDMIISHHPVIFKPIRSLGDTVVDKNILYPLIKNDIVVYSAHTNLDKAINGVDDTLADLLGLEDVRVLVPDEDERYFKLVVFVPKGYEENIMQVIGDMGAGWIGNYSHCTFQSKGIGTFKPLEGTNPFIGSQGVIEKVEEVRLETIIPEIIVDDVVAAMIKAHPYEEVAYDLYYLANSANKIGLGRVGHLKETITLQEYTDKIKDTLKAKNVYVLGDMKKKVKKVVTCAGAGGDFVQQALDSGADVFITGEIKYHEILLARELGLSVIAPGHYETEIPAMEKLIDRLQTKCNALQYKVEVLSSSTQHETGEFI